ncbi:hypothetical protein [Dermabacter vaginalis]|nr:hypothetical protein [Dermabacter vaginalis]
MDQMCVGYEDNGLPDTREKLGALAKMPFESLGGSREEMHDSLRKDVPHLMSEVLRVAGAFLAIGIAGSVTLSLLNSDVLPAKLKFFVPLIMGFVLLVVLPFILRIVQRARVRREQRRAEREAASAYHNAPIEGVYTLDERGFSVPKEARFSDAFTSSFQEIRARASKIVAAPTDRTIKWGRSKNGKGLWLDREGLALLEKGGERRTYPWHDVSLSITKASPRGDTNLVVHLPHTNMVYFGMYLDVPPSEIIAAAERFRSGR